MGKASRNKKLKRQQTAVLKHYDNVKLSEALLILCEPYEIPDMSKEDYEKIISVSAIAWNIASFPENIREQKMLEMMHLIPELEGLQKEEIITLMQDSTPNEPSDTVVMLQILFGMLNKRIELYPNDDRVIMDFWFEEKLGQDVLQVKSVILNAKKLEEASESANQRT